MQTKTLTWLVFSALFVLTNCASLAGQNEPQNLSIRTGPQEEDPVTPGPNNGLPVENADLEDGAEIATDAG